LPQPGLLSTSAGLAANLFDAFALARHLQIFTDLSGSMLVRTAA
jgi:hypothetical protein